MHATPTTPAGPANNPVDHCLRQIAGADEDLFLSLNYAPAPDRARLAALFAFIVELRRIPAAVSEAPIGEIRLQWQRDALDEIAAGGPPRSHPVILALASSGAAATARPLLEEMIDARARLLYEPRFTTVEDLAGFLRSAEAPLAELALGAAPAAARAAARALGEAHALARLAPSFAPELADDAARVALDLRARHAPALRGLSGEAFGRIAWLALIRGHARRPRGGPWPVMKRLALLRAVSTGEL